MQLRHTLARHLFAGAGSLGSLKSEQSVDTEQDKCGGAFVQLRHKLANALRAEVQGRNRQSEIGNRRAEV